MSKCLQEDQNWQALAPLRDLGRWKIRQAIAPFGALYHDSDVEGLEKEVLGMVVHQFIPEVQAVERRMTSQRRLIV